MISLSETELVVKPTTTDEAQRHFRSRSDVITSSPGFLGMADELDFNRCKLEAILQIC